MEKSLPLLGSAVALVAALTASVQAATPAQPQTPEVKVPPVQQSGPAWSREQVEADWLRQEELRHRPTPNTAAQVGKEEDAAGACDGVKDGKWGFHTQLEDNPWWQIDLGHPTSLERVVLFNRCDIPQRNSRIMLLVSDDGKSFRQVYQNNGTVFYGHTDQKPLEVRLDGVTARYVRLQVPGKSYFHLDEVEIYASGSPTNIALGRPATQSSTSQWSARHERPGERRPVYRTAVAIERGLKLAERLRGMGVNVEAETASLHRIAEQLKQLPSDGPEQFQRELYLQAREGVRTMALKNPLLDFDSILFVKGATTSFPHMSDQFYGWFSRPGGGLFLLEGLKSGQPRIRCLTSAMPEGNFCRPELSYDGKKVLFAFAKYYPYVQSMEKVDKDQLPEDAFYHVFEMNVDGSGLRQLTFGRYDDFDARYLPDGEIVFLSTRKGKSLQVCRACTEATNGSTQPDSYVRCGGGNTRPVAVYTLHLMDADGKNLRPISAFENFEWTPAVASDGRILYSRWDYIDRFNGPYVSLWSTNPDGTNSQLIYGNYTIKPQCVLEAQPIPRSRKLIFTASAHHSIIGGSLVLLDRTLGTEEERPLVRLTPEVCFPETEGWSDTYYANPHPLSEEFFLVAWSDRRLPGHTLFTNVWDPNNPQNAMGIYLYDAFGNLELLYRDPNLSSMSPLPVRARPKAPAIPPSVVWDGPQEGRFLLQDVSQGLGVPQGTVKRLRVVAILPKVQPQMNTPNLGVSKEDPGKFVLGTVPVEADGSAYFRVPSGVPVFFQALDTRGLALQTMRSITYVQPQQTQSCIGCHESRDSSPPRSRPPLAALREPSKLTLGPEGSWPLRFDRLVQPVLDQHCVCCHKPGSDNPKAAKLDLTPAKAYESLLSFGDKDLEKLAFERSRSVPGECPAEKSKLYALLAQPQGHEGVRLDAASLERLITWMDTYAHKQGSFSAEQERELEAAREAWLEDGALHEHAKGQSTQHQPWALRPSDPAPRPW